MLPWLNTLPSHWPRLNPDFVSLRSFQISIEAAALVVPKSQLGWSDSVIKALEVDAGASFVTDDISYSPAGILASQYRCVHSRDDPKTAADKRAKKAAGTSNAAAASASASLALLSELGAEPTNAAAIQLVSGLKATAATAAATAATGYNALLFEAWPQLEYPGHGRSSEDYTLPYIGQERHEETDPCTRADLHGTRAGCENVVHIAFTTGRGDD